MSTPVHTPDAKKPREEGMVLMIVVLVLMVLTATGTYTAYATTAEVTGAGASAHAYQTEAMAASVAEATIEWVDRVGPAAVYSYAERNAVSTPLDLAGLEPELAPGQLGTRVYLEDLTRSLDGTDPVQPVDSTSLNPNSPYTPSVVIDIYDLFRFTGDVAGSRSDGAGAQSFLKATYTVRTRNRIEMDDSVDELVRNRHTASANARAMGTSGPFNM